MSKNQETFSFLVLDGRRTERERDWRIRRQTISFAMSVRPHVTVRFTLDGFSWNLSIFRKSAAEIQVSFKSDKNKGYFTWRAVYIYGNHHHHHHHKHQELDPLNRSVSIITAARVNASSVFQLFTFLVVCSGMISKGFDFVAFFASVKASSFCIHLSCLVCL